ncbi:MAG: molybdate ABC transporter substrate-binding protein [Spirochaetaceae bacterium]
MKKIVLIFTITLVIFLISVKPINNKSEYITLFIASSSTDLMEELSDLYSSKTGIKIKLSPASSGVLAKQVLNGATADIYISASKKWMDHIEHLTIRIEPFLSNSLVLISPKDSDLTFNLDNSFPGSFTGKLSVGDPDYVPAGAYAKEVLEFYDWYEILESRLLPGANVRAALSVVEMSETEFGIVYNTDALRSKKVKIVEVFSEESHNKIEYYCALLNNNKQAADLYKFLIEDEEAKQIYKTNGFSNL